MKTNVFMTAVAILGMVTLGFASGHTGGNGLNSSGDKGNGITIAKEDVGGAGNRITLKHGGRNGFISKHRGGNGFKNNSKIKTCILKHKAGNGFAKGHRVGNG